MEPAKVMPSFTQISFAFETLTFEQTKRPNILRVRICLEAMQTEGVKGEFDEQPNRFRREPLTPCRLCNRKPDLCAPMDGVDVEQRARSKDLARLARTDAPLEKAPSLEQSV
ncbi:MAG TPA: hypothetical protein VNW92_01450, partial [Polyangiaceae bacterium]|nr:hypothetical protein [Polyangiaceae bacterium]